MNIYARFRQLTPGQPLRYATVVTDHGDGTATVVYLGGASGRVRGSASGAVWVRDGVIESDAPVLSETVVTI